MIGGDDHADNARLSTTGMGHLFSSRFRAAIVLRMKAEAAEEELIVTVKSVVNRLTTTSLNSGPGMLRMPVCQAACEKKTAPR